MISRIIYAVPYVMSITKLAVTLQFRIVTKTPLAITQVIIKLMLWLLKLKLRWTNRMNKKRWCKEEIIITADVFYALFLRF